MSLLLIVAGWIVTLFVGALGLLVLWKMYTNKIDLTMLISEPNGDASLSRFQFLLFTFIIGMSIFLLMFADPNAPKFPDIPTGVLGLLGISAGSYVVAKGIQAQRDTKLDAGQSTQALAGPGQVIGAAANGTVAPGATITTTVTGPTAGG
jgi:hypothetical protein